MKYLISTAFIALGMFSALHSNAWAADSSTCEVYARNAVAANDRAARMGCGFASSNARWQSNYNSHYGWCLNASSSALVSEAAGRDNDLRPCMSLSTRCESYAEQATRQFGRSQLLNCGFTPQSNPTGRWSNDHKSHYGWCMTAKPEWLTSEANARSTALSQCFSQ
ncbi:hypothetical protein [Thiofilum flexile]|uniref:hypothetical protein n=1 Tax=Thiofilum flexile TaxID=125627 RepID=UPI000377FFD2|nr:hypothetical protein [Thiofilum flexile]